MAGFFIKTLLKEMSPSGGDDAVPSTASHDFDTYILQQNRIVKPLSNSARSWSKDGANCSPFTQIFLDGLKKFLDCRKYERYSF